MAKKARQGFMRDFDKMQKQISKDARHNDITSIFQSLTTDAITFLSDNTDTIELKSLVTGKQYIAFNIDNSKSRPVNKNLFSDVDLVAKFLDLVKADDVRGNISSADITSACYTIVMSLACYVDLTNKGDRQTPGTFFQYLITHILTKHFKSNPSTRVKVQIGDDVVSLTMDLILSVDEGRTKYHIAVKNSTRERASEIWAHQKILDKAFGDNTYTGLFIGLAETKLAHTSNEVTEICVPDQWRAYQAFISNLHTIYYLDIPTAYRNLYNKPPYIIVRPFGDFFYDIEPE